MGRETVLGHKIDQTYLPGTLACPDVEKGMSAREKRYETKDAIVIDILGKKVDNSTRVDVMKRTERASENIHIVVPLSKRLGSADVAARWKGVRVCEGKCYRVERDQRCGQRYRWGGHVEKGRGRRSEKYIKRLNTWEFWKVVKYQMKCALSRKGASGPQHMLPYSAWAVWNKKYELFGSTVLKTLTNTISSIVIRCSRFAENMICEHEWKRSECRFVIENNLDDPATCICSCRCAGDTTYNPTYYKRRELNFIATNIYGPPPWALRHYCSYCHSGARFTTGAIQFLSKATYQSTHDPPFTTRNLKRHVRSVSECVGTSAMGAKKISESEIVIE